MKEPLVYIIVLNWNGIEHLETLFTSLHALAYRNRRIVMVDNASTDGSREYVRDTFPGVFIIRNESNIGFSAANNVGFRYALEEGADFVVLLNNDMEVDEGWISRLVEAAGRDESIGACATKMLYFYNRDIINGIGICLSRIGVAWDYLNGRYDMEGLHVEPEVAGACGGAFFVRADALRKAGLFDPVYFTYFEDVELSLRIWNAGYRIVTVPDARVYHKFAATMVENSHWKNYLVWRNRYRMLMKCWPAGRLARDVPALVLWEWRRALSHLLCGDRRGLLVQAAALVTPLKRFPSIVRSRVERGPITSGRVWRLVSPDSRPRPIRLPQAPSPGWTNPASASFRPAGDDAQRGTGWYMMWDEGDSDYRWFAREASLSLKPEREGPAEIHLVVGNDYRHLKEIALTVSVNGKEAGSIRPAQGWRDYVVPATIPDRKPLMVDLKASGLYSADETGELTDLSFKVREVSLRPAGRARSAAGSR